MAGLGPSTKASKTSTDLAQAWISDISARGKNPSDITPAGSRSDVRLGASLARHVNDGLVQGKMDVEIAKTYLDAALSHVCSGQWEATRWWEEREEGVMLIGEALCHLTGIDPSWAEGFLMRYFNVARVNGRHACWLHLLHAMGALQLLSPGVLADTWQHLQAVEESVLAGRVQRAHGYS